MTDTGVRLRTTPREQDLGLRYLSNASGLSLSLLPSGAVFAIEHRHARGRTQINQILGSPLDGGIARLFLRVGGPQPRIVEAYGPHAKVRFAAAADRCVWDGQSADLYHRLTLWLHPGANIWLWRLDVENQGDIDLPCDAILAQDLGLADRAFLMNNEAYASQYIDHHISDHPQLGPVVMSRQNLAAQHDDHPWVMHACLDGAAGFATDGLQVFGPAYRDAGEPPHGIAAGLPSQRLQHELACAAIQSRRVTVKSKDTASCTFAGLYEPDHPAASSAADFGRIDVVRTALDAFAPRDTPLATPARSILQDAPPLATVPLREGDIAARYPVRLHDETDHVPLSFFVPDGPHNRHVVLQAKEQRMQRRHGNLLRTGQALLPDDAIMCATFWMHGVFGAQLTLGNTSFHKLFSVSRDPYNITRGSGLRILADCGDGWQLLTVPSAFEMGLSDCRWIYRADTRTITVHAIAAGDDPAIQWRITVEGEPCRFLVFGNLVLGEREFEHAARIEIDPARRRFMFRPDPDSLWGQNFKEAEYHLVVSTPAAVEEIGGDELLYLDRQPRGGAYISVRSRPTNELAFAVVGSLRSPAEASALASKYTTLFDAPRLLAPAMDFWRQVTHGLRVTGESQDAAAVDTTFPWLAHNAIIHLTVPHGLEQYTGGAWGTRDVCQGPVEFLLALEHDAAVKDILRIVFSQQYETRADWPQWFMLEPYARIQDPHSHGDVIIWPLKALCDYLECTNDLKFLDEPIAWRREDNFAPTTRKDSVSVHVRKLLDALSKRFIPGTRLVKLGEGDWNDSLQPVDPDMRERMVSSWTVALLFQQISRYAEVMRRAGRDDEAARLGVLAAEMQGDFNRHLVVDDVVTGYAVFDTLGKRTGLLLHPADTITGVHYSLLPMTRAIIAGLFTSEQAQRHLQLIREHLLFPDGVRLMDRPIAYRGGPEQTFRRAESAAFFGREIGLMYVHAHLRYGEALAVLGESDAAWQALLLANPIVSTERVANASLRQRNAYFTSSDAAFADRYQASAHWGDVKRGGTRVDAGWRIYSSGPGIYVGLLLASALGRRRYFGAHRPTAMLQKGLLRVDVVNPTLASCG